MATKKNSLADTMRQSVRSGNRKITVEETLRPGTSDLTRRTTIYFTEETAKELKIAAIKNGTNMSQIVEGIAVDWLLKHGREQ
ncbi:MULTISPECIES: hypothetical protein [Actinomycetes]|uniref:hypothetical protein n=1 Tax=Actinomycetes TaxID=1760 RepID=UPI00264786B2|nr:MULTISPECIES: hypothetical protein [Actinomycetes]MDN6457239.1 hypothetical protein [Yaniella sp.]MDN6646398.1 hypothetical protein [Corynebacterium flavescens]